jgi:predicted nicotinamide N-methyase
MPGYATKQEWVSIAGAEGLQIRSLLDRQQYADPLGAALALGISSATWPLFGLLWPSGAELAAMMAVRAVVAGERVLEVGCGLGLSSLVMHRRGADVTASDCHPLAGAFLAANASLNRLLPIAYRQGAWAPHDAGTEAAVEGRYGLIIGSDVLYDRDASAALAGFIGRHGAAHGEVCIVDPDRSNRAAFSRGLALLGYSLVERRLDHAATPGTTAYKGRLLRYRRGAGGGPG